MQNVPRRPRAGRHRTIAPLQTLAQRAAHPNPGVAYPVQQEDPRNPFLDLTPSDEALNRDVDRVGSSTSMNDGSEFEDFEIGDDAIEGLQATITNQLDNDEHNHANVPEQGWSPPASPIPSFHSRDSNDGALDSGGPDPMDDERGSREGPTGAAADVIEGRSGPSVRFPHALLNGEYRLWFSEDLADRFEAKPCDAEGNFLPDGELPIVDPPRRHDWSPFESRAEFELAELLFVKARMSHKNINNLLDIWYSSFLDADVDEYAPFANRADLLSTIDCIEVGDAPWKAFAVRYQGAIPEQNAPKWMFDEYLVCYRDPEVVIDNILSNTDFEGQIDYVPFKEYNADMHRIYSNYMSGNFAYEQAVGRFRDCPEHHTEFSQDILGRVADYRGAMFVPLIIGNDKTTVSVATGQNDFYPVYMSIGNVHNSVRRAHRNALIVIAFLAIPKSKNLFRISAD